MLGSMFGNHEPRRSMEEIESIHSTHAPEKVRVSHLLTVTLIRIMLYRKDMGSEASLALHARKKGKRKENKPGTVALRT
jgi:hypothetical protein